MPERRRRACRRSGHGFTLVELVVSVAVMGIVITSLASGVLVVLRTMDTTTRRLDETKDEQNLVTWLPVDVAAAPAANLQTNSTLPSGCGRFTTYEMWSAGATPSI